MRLKLMAKLLYLLEDRVLMPLGIPNERSCRQHESDDRFAGLVPSQTPPAVAWTIPSARSKCCSSLISNKLRRNHRWQVMYTFRSAGPKSLIRVSVLSLFYNNESQAEREGEQGNQVLEVYNCQGPWKKKSKIWSKTTIQKFSHQERVFETS